MKDKIKKLFDTKTTRGKIMRASLFVLILVLIFVVAYFILKATGAWEKVNSIDKIRDIVQSGGMFSFLIFIIFQILQTTILQIPAIFVTIAGAVIFGRWPAFIMSYVAVMIGSLIMFWVGRKAGRKFLNWMIGKDTSEKWIDRMSRGKYLFFLMMLFPMFPDDILCVVAGLTNMSFSFFFWTNILARGIGIACTVFFGSGAIIPFRGWGLIVWGIIIIAIAVLFYLSVRYKNKIDDIINYLFRRKNKNSETAEKTQVMNEDIELLTDKNNQKISENVDNNQDNFDKAILPEEQKTKENSLPIKKQDDKINSISNGDFSVENEKKDKIKDFSSIAMETKFAPGILNEKIEPRNIDTSNKNNQSQKIIESNSLTKNKDEV